MAEKSFKSILYDRTVDYASRMVKNAGVMNFMGWNTVCWNVQRHKGI